MRNIFDFSAENAKVGDCVADGAVCCEPVSVANSLIYRENTGKFFDFGLNLGFARSETAAVADAFFGNSLKFGTGN
jgi:hypothetical protein